MERFESPLQLVPDQEINIRKKQDKEYRLMGSFFIWKGMKLFSVNLKTLEVKKEKVTTEVILSLAGDAIHKNKVFFNPDCKYLLALNEKSARRKAVKIIKQAYSI
jgi:hypothetical protein